MSTGKKGALIATNAVMTICWLNVLFVLLKAFSEDKIQDDNFCTSDVKPALDLAITASFIEALNAVFGITKAKPAAVMMFVIVRAGVEFLAAPLLPCACWQHMFTAVFWAFGETFRFGCFTTDALVDGLDTAKSVRYTVGPIAFLCGASGEWTMVLKLAFEDEPTRSFLAKAFLWFCAATWPLGFSILFKQLLSQRKKHFKALKEKVKST